MGTIQRTPQFISVLQRLEQGHHHLFITGKAGTGKSTLLTYYRTHTTSFPVVLAPTGVAAVHVQGETIHSFFRFQPNITPPEAKRLAYHQQENNLYTDISTLIIDEISMVRADLLDCVDQFLKTARQSQMPFGGVRMIFFGDLYQLPPVVTSKERDIFREVYKSEWFFDSQVMEQVFLEEPSCFELVELETIFRQSDPAFIDLLNRVRLRTVEERHIDILNTLVTPEKKPQRPPFFSLHKQADPPITLTGRRDTAARINAEQLESLRGKQHVYTGSSSGHFPDGHLPTDEQLTLKIGARVMFVANDSEGKFVNGTLGTVQKLTATTVSVHIDGKGIEEVSPHTWELSHTVVNTSQQLEKKKVGTFTQIPLMLAWAVTIHKSQGKTFDHVVINLEGGAFTHGQMYVALSRCRTFEGMALTHPITLADIRMQRRVSDFFVSFAMKEANILQSPEEKLQRIQDAIEMQSELTLTYLKGKNEQSIRQIIPKKVAPMEYKGRQFPGLEAHCCLRNETRIFNLERVLHVQ